MTKRNPPKINLKFDATWLPYIAAIVQGGLYSMAGNVYFGNYFTGSLLGVLPSLSIAFGSSRLAGVSAKERKAEARFFRNALLVISPAVVSPAIFHEIRHLDYGNSTVSVIVNIMVAILVAIIPDFSIYFAGVIAGGSLMNLSSSQSDTIAPQIEESNSQSGSKAGGKTRSAKKQAACPFGCGKMLSGQRNEAGEIVPTTNALNAHSKHCPKKEQGIE